MPRTGRILEAVMADADHTIDGRVRGREAMGADRAMPLAQPMAPRQAAGSTKRDPPPRNRRVRIPAGSTASDGGPAADGRASGCGVADHATSVMKFSRARRTFFWLTSQSLSASR